MDAVDAFGSIEEAFDRVVDKRLINVDNDDFILNGEEVNEILTIPDDLPLNNFYLNDEAAGKMLLEDFLNLADSERGKEFLSLGTKLIETTFSILLAKLIELGLEKNIATDYLSGLFMLYGGALNHCVFDGRNEFHENLKENKILIEKENEDDKIQKP